jgi:PAS domain S-box-containing protein
MKNAKLSALLNTPHGIVIVVAAVVLATEFLFMSFLRYIETQFNISVMAMNFIDAFTVTAAVVSLLYFLVFRKMQGDMERHRQINAAALNAIVIADEQGRITGWNPAAEKMFQYSEEEAVGQPMHQLITPPHYRDDAARGFARFQESGSGPLIGKVTEISALRKDGGEFPIELSLSAAKMQGRWHAIGVIRDITERKETEAAFHILVRAAAANIGEAFFHETVRSLSAWLGAECVIIGELEDGNRVRALAMQLDGKAVEHYEYALPGTPCNNVAHKGYCEYPEGVSQLFPADKDLSDMGAEAYVGTPVRDKNGETVGVLCAISRHKIVLPPMLKGIFEIIAARAGKEIEHKRAEKLASAQHAEIMRARLDWNAVFDSVRYPIFLHDSEFRVIRANRAYAEQAGKPFKEIIGQPYYTLFPKSGGPLPCCLRAMEKAEEEEEEEEVMVGEAIYRSRTFSVRNEQDVYLYSVHMLEDITERKQIESVLRESEERYRSLFENMLEGYAYCRVLFEHDTPLDFIYLDVNDAFKKITGLKEVVGKKVTEVIPGIRASNPELFEIYGRVALTGQPEKFETYIDTLGIWFSVTAYSLRKEYFVAVFDDITERKRVEEELRLRAQLLDSTGDSIFVADFDGNFVYLNEAAWKSRGYTRDELMGMNLHVLDVPEYEKLIEARIRELEEKGQSTFESAHRRKDGSVMPIEVSARIIESGGRKLVLSAARDITERQQAEQKKLEADTLLKNALENAIGAIAATLEQRDPYTAGHQRRVAQLAAAIGEEMELAHEVIEGLHFGGLIHDIGKISVPAEILGKPGRLTDIEFGLIEVHAEAGYQIVKDIAFPWPVADMVRQHHERLDGSGYPQGLKGEQIVLEARILAVVDVVEAMSANRPYRPGFGMDAALEEIARCRGTQLDAVAVDACLRVVREKGFVFSR